MRSLTAIAFAFVMMVTAPLGLVGCGGGSGSVSGGGNNNPTITSVSVTVAPSSITTTQTSQATASVSGTGSYSSTVTWAVSPSGMGTVSTSGLFTPAQAGMATITATSTQDTSKSGSATVTVTIANQVTAVLMTPSSATITDAQTLTVTPTVTLTGTVSNAVDLTVTPANAGTLSATTNVVSGTAVTFTPAVQAGLVSATITAVSKADATKSASTAVTITHALPTITSVSPSVYQIDGQGGTAAFEIDGTGFSANDLVGVNSPYHFHSQKLVSSTKIQVELELDQVGARGGKAGFMICESDKTTCSNTSNVVLMNPVNTGSFGKTGELFHVDPTGVPVNQKPGQNGVMRKFTISVSSDGKTATAVPSGSFYVGYRTAMPADVSTGYLLDGVSTLDANGNLISNAATETNNGIWIDQEASGGYTCATQPFGNPVASATQCFQEGVDGATLYTTSVGNEAWLNAMGTFTASTPSGPATSTTYSFVYSRRGTPTVWTLTASNANPVGSYAPAGVTDSASLQPGQGGWGLVAFDQGPSAGTVVHLSRHDKLLTAIKPPSQLVKQIALDLGGGDPVRITADTSTGNVIVAYLDASGNTKLVSVNPSSGVLTPMKSTSPLTPQTLVVSPDGKWIVIGEAENVDVQPKQ